MKNLRQQQCRIRELISRDFLQIKSSQSYLFISHFPAYISIGGSSMRCPNSAIQVDEGQIISIDGEDIDNVTAHQLGHVNDKIKFLF